MTNAGFWSPVAQAPAWPRRTAYRVGGALFALEVLRGELALRFVLPALVTAAAATGASWAFLPDTPTYHIPEYHGSVSVAAWALVAGPIVGLISVLYVRSVAWADRHKPTGGVGCSPPSSRWPPGSRLHPLPACSATAETSPNWPLPAVPLPLWSWCVLRPAATLMCLGSGAPGGLFTPSLALGAMLGGVLGVPWSWLWPGLPPGLFALLGSAAMLAASTQGPISTVVLMMELTGYARAAIVPLLLIVVIATLIARTIEPRSVYDARLSDAEVAERQRARDQAA